MSFMNFESQDGEEGAEDELPARVTPRRRRGARVRGWEGGRGTSGRSAEVNTTEEGETEGGAMKRDGGGGGGRGTEVARPRPRARPLPRPRALGALIGT